MTSGEQHPETSALKAFGEGRVSAAERDALQSHLDVCELCCQTLARLSDDASKDDAFVARLRRVGERVDASSNAKTAPAGAIRVASVASMPNYEILRELGRGGMGVVYLARQIGLNRLVALKVLLAGSHAGPDEQARFRAEAEAVAHLRHENIVQIHDIGNHNNLPYFALEYCDGGNLADKIHGEPQPPRDAARLVETLARGVHAAHGVGIIHRDLKPANILLASSGASFQACSDRPSDLPSNKTGKLGSLPHVPKISDFGLAKWLEHDASLTGTNAILGTPSYMSPEQAVGQKAGAASDIYSLGTILYELLAGRPPFRGPTPLDTIALVKLSEPVPPSRLQPGVPRDLETICLKCLQKEPSRRYATAQDLADDLRAFQNNEPIRARPAGPIERGFLWAQRRPAIASLLAAIVAVAATGFGLVLWQLIEKQEAFRQVDKRREEADIERGKAVAARNDAEELAANLRLDKGIDLAERGDIAAGLHWMLEALRTAPKDAANLRRVARLNLATWMPHTPTLQKIVDLPDDARCFALHPDGNWLAIGGDQRVHWLDVAANKPFRPAWQVLAWTQHVAFSPDGSKLLTSVAVSRNAAQVQSWVVTTGGLLFEGPLSDFVRPVFRPDSAMVALAENELLDFANPDKKFVRIRAAQSGKMVTQIHPEIGPNRMDHVSALAFSPDGKKLVIAAGLSDWLTPNTAQIFDLASVKAVGDRLRHQGSITSIAYSPDGRTVVTGSLDRTAQIWNADNGWPIGSPLLHGHAVESVVFAPDGRSVLTRDAQSGLFMWDAATGQRVGGSLPKRSDVAPQFSADGKFLVTAVDFKNQVSDQHRPSHALFWRPGTSGASGGAYGGLPVGTMADLKTDKFPFDEVFFSPDGVVALVGSRSGSIRLFDAGAGQPRGPEMPLKCPFTLAAFSRDSMFAAVARTDLAADNCCRCEVCDGRTGQSLAPLLPHHRRVMAMAFTADSRRLITGDLEGRVRFWDVKSGELLEPSIPLPAGIAAMSLSPDGRTLPTN